LPVPIIVESEAIPEFNISSSMASATFLGEIGGGICDHSGPPEA